MSVKVKPLEWEEHPDGGEWWSVDHGDWGISEYDISPNPVGSDIRMRVRGHLLDQEFDSVRQAKAAAEADYEHRILSALEGKSE